LGDIGVLFPDDNQAYADADSRKLLHEVVARLAEVGLRASNVDVTVVAQRPKLRPYIEAMRKNLAADLALAPERVSVKATTTEQMGFVGREEGIAAHAVVLLLEAGE